MEIKGNFKAGLVRRNL